MQGSQQRSRVMGQALLGWLRASDGVRPEGALRSASWRKGGDSGSKDYMLTARLCRVPTGHLDGSWHEISF